MYTQAQTQVVKAFRRDCTDDERNWTETFDGLTANCPSVKKWVVAHTDAVMSGKRDTLDLPYAARQLDYVYETAVEVQFADLAFADQTDPIITFDGAVQPGAKTFTWRMIEYAGHAEFFAAMGADGLPSPTVMGAESVGMVQEFGSCIEVSTQALRSAAYANQPLEAQLGKADKRGHSERLNDTIAWGREEIGLPGFLNHPNLGRSAAPLGASGFSAWDTKTAGELIADVLGLVNSIPDDTDEIFRANTIIAPARYIRLLSQARLSDGQDGSKETVMTYLDEAFAKVGNPIRWRAVEDLRGSKSQGWLDDDAIVAFNDDLEMVRAVVPFFYELEAVQQVLFKLKTPSESALGGVQYRFPLSGAMLTGVGDT